jgi:hypothetical protein
MKYNEINVSLDTKSYQSDTDSKFPTINCIIGKGKFNGELFNLFN